MSKVIFNFDDLTSKDKAFKAVSTYFKKAGAEIVQADVLPSIKRTSGIKYRELSLTFADSQILILRIKETGDIYQVLLNGRVKPMAQQDNHESAIVEMVKAMEQGRAAFQKRLANKKVKVPTGIKTTVPNKEKALIQERDSLKVEIEKAEKRLEELKAS